MMRSQPTNPRSGSSTSASTSTDSESRTLSRLELTAQSLLADSACKKFFKRVIPLLLLMYVINQIDRSNVGFVREQLEADLGIGAAAYGLGAGLFFVGYVLFEVPSNMLLERLGARIWLTRIMITWGIVVIATAFAWNTTSFYILRFLLGVAEAGFLPGIVLYLTFWLPSRFRGRAMAIVMTASAISSMVTGPISGALLGLHGVAAIAGWQWVFIAMGVISVVVGVIAIGFLPSNIHDARWLTADEKDVLTKEIETERKERESGSKVSTFRLIVAPGILLMGAIYFTISLTGYALIFWLPTVVRQIGDLSDLEVGFLAAVPWLFAITAMYLSARVADRHGGASRYYFVAAALALAAIGTLSASQLSAWTSFAALCLAAIGFKASVSLFWPIPQGLLEPRIAAPGIALINSLGNIGGFVAPTVLGIIESTTGTIDSGLIALSVGSLIGVGLVLGLGRWNTGRITSAV